MAYLPPEPIASALIRNKRQIGSVIADAVDYSFRAAFHELHTRVGEVEKLIYFFMDGLPVIENGVNRLLKNDGVTVTISGIFCHQTPKVKSISPYAAPESCELGDIAFLATYGDLTGSANNDWGNALLMQAKDNYHKNCSHWQEKLYEECRTFKYLSPDPLAGNDRDLSKSLHCLYYWNFNQYSNIWWPKHTESILARPKDITNNLLLDAFEDTLTDLFCGVAGKSFQQTPAGKGWNQIIHDLITNASTRSIRHKRIFSKRGYHPDRTFNYRSLVDDSAPAPSFIRCSLSEFLSNHPDKGIKEICKKLESESDKYDLTEERSSHDRGEKPPTLISRGGESDDNSGGGSFIVFQFKQN